MFVNWLFSSPAGEIFPDGKPGLVFDKKLLAAGARFCIVCFTGFIN